MRLHFHRYRLPLTAPLPGGTRAEREGVLVEAVGAGGRSGWGEAAPLPGFSRETLDEVAARARAFAADLEGAGLSVDVADPLGSLGRRLGGAALPPSLRFGVEQALLDLFAAGAGRTLPEVLGPRPLPVVRLGALLTGEADLRGAAARRREEGYAAVKLKVGGRLPEEAAAVVRGVRTVLGPHVELRLDANRSWTLDEALRFADACADSPFAYLEEPLADPSGLASFAEESGLPVALDESLCEMAPADLRAHAWARAVVLKPTLLGGLGLSAAWAREAVALGMTPVVSAAYESGVGLRGLVALAAVAGPAAAGLDTYRRLAADVVDPSPPLDRPAVDVPTLFRRPSVVDRVRLTPLP